MYVTRSQRFLFLAAVVFISKRGVEKGKAHEGARVAAHVSRVILPKPKSPRIVRGVRFQQKSYMVCCRNVLSARLLEDMDVGSRTRGGQCRPNIELGTSQNLACC